MYLHEAKNSWMNVMSIGKKDPFGSDKLKDLDGELTGWDDDWPYEDITDIEVAAGEHAPHSLDTFIEAASEVSANDDESGRETSFEDAYWHILSQEDFEV